MLIIDSHLDLAWNALEWSRDLLRSAYTTRTMEGRVSGKARASGTVGLPEMRQARIAICFGTLIARSTGNPVANLDYPSPTQAYAAACGHLAYYRGLQQEGHVQVITELEQLERHMAEWEAWDAEDGADPESSPPLGVVVSMESADPVLSPDRLQEWWNAGLRLIGPSHYGPGRYAGGTGTEMGITELGALLLSEMERLGIALDLTHLSDQAFWEALEKYSGPVLASHNNCRALVRHQRQFSDDQLREIIRRGGVIGVAFDNWMLKTGWIIGKGDARDVTLDDVIRHIDHICQLAGNSGHVAIGTDLDGGFGTEQTPRELDTIADLQKLAPLLADRGFKKDDVAAILHGNWLRFLRQSWS